MLQNCFLDPALKAKLAAVKTPNLKTLTKNIIESHTAGKKVAQSMVSANALKSRGNFHQQQSGDGLEVVLNILGNLRSFA